MNHNSLTIVWYFDVCIEAVYLKHFWAYVTWFFILWKPVFWFEQVTKIIGIRKISKVQFLVLSSKLPKLGLTFSNIWTGMKFKELSKTKRTQVHEHKCLTLFSIVLVLRQVHLLPNRGLGSCYKLGGQDRESFPLEPKVGGQMFLFNKGQEKSGWAIAHLVNPASMPLPNIDGCKCTD